MDPLKANFQTERCSASAWRSRLQSSFLLHVTENPGSGVARLIGYEANFPPIRSHTRSR